MSAPSQPGPSPHPGGYQRATAATAVRPRQPHDYTSWFARLVAFVIDAIPYLVIVGVGIGVEVGTRVTLCAPTTTEYDLGPYCATSNTTWGFIAFLSSVVIGFAYLLWNYGYRQGTTGSSIGKSVMRFQVCGEKTGQPIGFAMSSVRQIVHALDALVCFVGYLLPLWDSRRQTLADKVLKTVCLPTN